MESCRYNLNSFRVAAPDLTRPVFSNDETLEFHGHLEGYAPSPLISLEALAKELGVGKILVKDESHRFGLNAFKGLGASYAIFKFIQKMAQIRSGSPFTVEDFFKGDTERAGRFTFCTATDGNHGRAVAWTAKRLNQRAVIYVPKITVPARINAIKGEGAEVVVVDGTYDDTVKQAAFDAETNGWQVISDTAYPGYLEIPTWIMTGYGTIFKELEIQQEVFGIQKPDVVFMQAGVGGLACAGSDYYVRKFGAERPRLISVEPLEADCLLESSTSPNGEMRISKGNQNSIMAGLNCGTPSMLSWPVIRDAMDFFLAVPDQYAVEAMRRFYYPHGHDQKIISGESGAAGLAGLLALCQADELKEAKETLGFGPETVVLLINTEGDTDPEAFSKIVSAAE